MKIARGLSCFFLLMTLAGTLLAAVEVRGLVRDIYGRPLAGIEVRVGESVCILATDDKGEFAFAADDGQDLLQLTFASPLYHREKVTVALKRAPLRLRVLLVPIRLLKEEVTVTALNENEKAIAVPFAQSVVSAAVLQESRPETIVQAIQAAPGVHFIGKGGIAVTPSIRGLARRRILLMADCARITSDRSAGASAHFFPTEMVSRIEIVRSAASVLYGSDAIGGVIQIVPLQALGPEAHLLSLNLSGNSLDSRVNGGFALSRRSGDFSLFAALQAARAGDYAAGGERIVHSGYRYVTGDLVVRYETAQRAFSLSFLKSAGRDIGKPERANDPAVASFYPEENTNLLNLTCSEKQLLENGSLHFSLFLNPNDYELHKVKQADSQVEISRNRAFDFGMRIGMKKEPAGRLAYQFGIDYFGRAGVDMENETWKSGSMSGSSFPVRGGRRSDLGAYAILTWAAPARLDIAGGARLSFSARSAVSAGVFHKKSSLAPAFFLGVTRRLGEAITLFINAGTAFRLPSLSEAFYSGITGRNTIVGNPNLDPEKSLNFDAGVRFHRGNVFLGAYLFQNSIRGMIEKFPLTDSSYTYDNLERGRIRGLEFEFQFYPLDRLEIFGNGWVYRGSSMASGKPLNDVPSARMLLGAKLWLGRFWGEVNWLAAAAVTRPGPAETAIPDYRVTDLKAGFIFSNRILASLKIANLFDKAYYANADPDIPLARGLDLSLGLNLIL